MRVAKPLDQSTPDELLKAHLETGEPLNEDELRAVVDAGLARWSEWENRGGGLYWHAATWPEPDAG